jgi:hypothetical protein
VPVTSYQIFMQTKTRSFKEAVINTAIGFIISLITTPLVFSVCDVKYTGMQMGKITALMTIISIARSYIIRRWFNKGDK